MPKLTPIQLDKDTTIYIQVAENITISPTATPQTKETPSQPDFLLTEPQQDENRDFPRQKQVTQSFQAVEKTIRAYTAHLINSFKTLALAEVSEVTLEFGVNVGGVTGIPYIATGNAECNVKVTVKCTFPSQQQT